MTDHAIALWAMGCGAVSAAVGIIAIIYAHLANRKSNAAEQLAKGAHDIAARGEAREIEQHDVRWEGQWDSRQPGRYLLIKRGGAEARNVRATVRYQGDDEQTVTADSVTEDGTALAFSFDEALRDYQDEYAARQEHAYEAQQARRGRSVQGIPIPTRVVMPYMDRTYHVIERVEWVTPMDTPKLHEESSLTTFSVYFGR